jgi:HPt (histidine-containing phosphotransfer) domain-containing protein
LSTSNATALASRVRRWFERREDARAKRDASVQDASSLPDLIERLGLRFAAKAARYEAQVALDVDPALEGDLVGPFAALGGILEALLSHAIEQAAGDVLLQIDVVGDEPGMQRLHIAVAVPGMVSTAMAHGALPPAFATASATVERLGGTFHVQRDGGLRAIAELVFIVPPQPPHVDVVALRARLGGEDALHEVIVALADALAADVGNLDGMLASGDVPATRRWLHRVAGALGMAEATGLATMGLRLEQALAVQPLAGLELAVRRFAMDAMRALAWLRESRADMPLV